MTEVTNLIAAPSTTPRRPGLADLVARLRPLARQKALPQTIAQQVAEDLTDIRPETTLLTEAERVGSADAYVRHTLHAETAFSVQAVVWRPGQFTEIHDHVVWCSFMVIQGAETETLYDVDGDHLVELGQRQRPTGSVSGVAPPDDIHRVTNTGDDVAITLHVYGADLSGRTSVRRTYRQRQNQQPGVMGRP